MERLIYVNNLQLLKGGDGITHRSTWKGYERRIARALGTERNPLSGGNSRHSRSDSLHKKLYIEAKLRDSMNKFLCSMMRDTVKECEENSKEEDKDWVLVFKEKYKKTSYVIMDFDFFLDLAKKANMKEVKNDE